MIDAKTMFDPVSEFKQRLIAAPGVAGEFAPELRSWLAERCAKEAVHGWAEMVTRSERKPKAREVDGKLFDLKQASRKLGTTEDQVRGFVQDGELRFINVGRGKLRPRLRFTEADLDEFIEQRKRKIAPCPSTNRRSHRSTGSTSKSEAVGFTAQRNAHLAKTPKLRSCRAGAGEGSRQGDEAFCRFIADRRCSWAAVER